MDIWDKEKRSAVMAKIRSSAQEIRGSDIRAWMFLAWA